MRRPPLDGEDRITAAQPQDSCHRGHRTAPGTQNVQIWMALAFAFTGIASLPDHIGDSRSY